MLIEEVIKRKVVPRVGRETIRVLLESHALKPVFELGRVNTIAI